MGAKCSAGYLMARCEARELPGSSSIPLFKLFKHTCLLVVSTVQNWFLATNMLHKLAACLPCRISYLDDFEQLSGVVDSGLQPLHSSSVTRCLHTHARMAISGIIASVNPRMKVHFSVTLHNRELCLRRKHCMTTNLTRKFLTP